MNDIYGNRLFWPKSTKYDRVDAAGPHPKKGSFDYAISQQDDEEPIAIDFRRKRSLARRLPGATEYYEAPNNVTKQVKKVSKSIQRNVTDPLRERIAFKEKTKESENVPLLNWSSLIKAKANLSTN